MNNGNWLEPPLGNAAKSVVADSTLEYLINVQDVIIMQV